MDNQNYSVSNYMDTEMNFGENIASPTQNHNQQNPYLSTPKVNRSINNTKSPLGKIKLKKSKRRECTPAYSPNKANGEYKGGFYHTEKKCAEYQKLNFDMIEVKEVDSSRISILNEGNEGVKNIQSMPPKKKFISLIEESLNDVSDSYYGVLGSQTTPDTIFKNIFGEDKEKKQSMASQSFRPSLESNDKECWLKNSTGPQNSVFEFICNVLNELKNKNFDFLNFMVKLNLIYILTFLEHSNCAFRQ